MSSGGAKSSDPRLAAQQSATPGKDLAIQERQPDTVTEERATETETTLPSSLDLPFMSESGRNELLVMLSKPDADIKSHLYVAKNFPSILIDLLYRVAVDSMQRAQDEIIDASALASSNSNGSPTRTVYSDSDLSLNNTQINQSAGLTSAQRSEITSAAVRLQFKPFFLFSNFIGKCPQITNFICNYFEKSSFQPFPSDLCSRSKSAGFSYKQPGFDDQLLIDILMSYFTYLSFDPKLFSTLWNWSELSKLLIVHVNQQIRYLSACCLAIITKPTREQFQRFLRKHFLDQSQSGKNIITFQRQFAFIYDDKFEPLVETESFPAQIFIQRFPPLIPYNYANKHLAKIVNVLLMKGESSNMLKSANKEAYVKVPSLHAHLSNLAYSISIGRPCLIRGPVGSGKTAIIDHIASETNRSEPPDFIRVQVGDQIDSKLLIGSYVCTEIPGQFEWRPGPLAMAISKGSWIVFEDIDFASSDMINVIHSIVENKSIESVSNCPMKLDIVHPNFRIFFTQRVSSYGRVSSDMMKAGLGFLERICDVVDLPQLTDEDLIDIIDSKFGLVKISEKLVKLFNLTVQAIVEASVSSTRKISLHDLFKIAYRLSAYKHAKNDLILSQIELEGIFLDFVECLLRFLPQSPMIEIAYKLGADLNLSQPQITRLCIERNPNIFSNNDYLNIGRVSLKLNKDKSTTHSIAYTRHTLCLMERIASCIKFGEAALLVGETGVGKTTIVQHMANLKDVKLVVINLSQQTDSSDFLGGFKPVEMSHMIQPIKQELEDLFSATFSPSDNKKFLGHISTCYANKKWMQLLRLIQQLYMKAVKHPLAPTLSQRWSDLQSRSDQFLKRLKLDSARSPMALSFVEGTLMRAIKEGHWILLDEVNLAEADVLQCLVSILDSLDKPFIHFCDPCNGPISIKKHPNFRVFACMNPSTDVGKRDLTTGIRNRFTEIFVDDILNKNDLRMIVNSYIKDTGVSPPKIDKLVEFYLTVRDQSSSLADTCGNSPSYSLRSLCRALQICSNNICNNTEKSLFEALRITFLQQLNNFSKKSVNTMISETVFTSSDIERLLNVTLPKPVDSHNYVNVEGYWIQTGSRNQICDDKYVLTESVRKNLENLARVVSLGQRRLPILIQGRTSVGKTSLITYLAKLTGNQCHRLNNHEHTDLQEYLGGFVMNAEGSVEFRDGLLTYAMKRGHWIILDELNLAPCELLEALNRVLDDNRELFIPENRKIIKAHSKFMLFATQNPPQDYSGRKVLSRAFRNRFVEMHFDEIPSDELETILSTRCEMPGSYAMKIVSVMKDLQLLRRESGFFAGKHGFMNLRDLFRWGKRYKAFKRDFHQDSFDWQKKVAEQGLTILQGRVRTHKEAEIVKSIIEKVFSRKLDYEDLYEISLDTRALSARFSHLHITSEFKRMYSQISAALENNEPILLCGPTGCGKTTACQIHAEQKGIKLYIANCHLNSESADFIGNIRPIRNKSSDGHNKSDESIKKPLYEWVDGPLVRAMKEGAYFLIDEISLADDAVLERINSVLENERTITLSEKMSSEEKDVTVKALPTFRIMATMNPGGDYGKKELSPALRNRFTEIYCHNTTNLKELGKVITHNLSPELSACALSADVITVMEEFLRSFYEEYMQSSTHVCFSMRDILSWTKFVNLTSSVEHPRQLSLQKAIYHGANLVFIDSIGTCGSICPSEQNDIIEFKAKKRLSSLIKEKLGSEPVYSKGINTKQNPQISKAYVNFQDFCIRMGPKKHPDMSCNFQFEVPSVKSNVTRIARAMQLDRPILLEGDPGIGKTSIISALAKITGHELIRINLSEQTDISDLFGSDLPVEMSAADGQSDNGLKFAWHDGPFLQALKESKWILLDEMNLASQSVLEGLNACLDHRGTIFIPELNKEFEIDRRYTRIFACQNPHRQGSSRKGLPQSFVNRFTSIYIKGHSSQDLTAIIRSLYPQLPRDLITKMVDFNAKVCDGITKDKSFGLLGSPWEFNLRDLIYWCDLTTKYVNDFGVTSSEHGPIYRSSKFVQLVYLDRMRSNDDKDKINDLFRVVFGHDIPPIPPVDIKIGDTSLVIGRSFLKRKTRLPPNLSNMSILKFQLSYMESLAKTMEMGKMAILVGERGVGKRSITRILANLAGHHLNILSANSEMDVVELLGSYEQKNVHREIARIVDEVLQIIYDYINSYSEKTSAKLFTHLFNHCWSLRYSISIKEPHLNNKDLSQAAAAKLSTLKDLMVFVAEEQVPEHVRTNITRLRKTVDALTRNYSKSQSISCNGNFEWMDSILVTSVKHGSWLLIENANLLNSSTLDRLNSLLETDGSLILNEKGADASGQIECLKPHPNFRLILSMDSMNGELSRAMRNRGVEIFMETAFHREDFYRILSRNGISLVLNRIPLPTLILDVCTSVDQDYVGEDSDCRHLTKFILQYGRSLGDHVCRGMPIEVVLGQLLHRYYSRHGFSSDSVQISRFIESIKVIMTKLRNENSDKVDDRYIYRNQWIEFNHDLFKYIGGDAVPANILRDYKLIDYSNTHLVIEDVVRKDEHLSHGRLVSITAAIKIFLEQSTFDDLEARLDFLKEACAPEVVGIITETMKYDNFVPIMRATVPPHWPLPFSVSEMHVDPRHCPQVYQVLLSSNLPEMLQLEKSFNCWLISHHWLMLKLLVDLIVKETQQYPGHESLLNISEMYKKGKLGKGDLIRPEIVQTIFDIYIFLKGTIIKNIINRHYSNASTVKMMHRLFWISYVICRFSAHHSKADLVAICNQMPMLWTLTYQKVILPIIRDCQIEEPFSKLYDICENLGLEGSMMLPIDKNLLRASFNKFAASYSEHVDSYNREASRFYNQLLCDSVNRSYAWSNSLYLLELYSINSKIVEELRFPPAFHPEDSQGFSDRMKKSEEDMSELKEKYKLMKTEQVKEGSYATLFHHNDTRREQSRTKFAPIWQFHFVHRKGCDALLNEYFADHTIVLESLTPSESGLFVSPIYHFNNLKLDKITTYADDLDHPELKMNLSSIFMLNHLQELRLFNAQMQYWIECGKEFQIDHPQVPEYSPILSILCSRNLNLQNLRFSSDVQITKHLRIFNQYLWSNFWTLLFQEDRDIIDLKLAEKWILSYWQLIGISTSDSDCSSDKIFKTFVKSRMEKSTELFTKLDSLSEHNADVAKALKLIIIGYNIYDICAPLYPVDPALRLREKIEVYKSELSHLKIELALRQVSFYRKTGTSLEKDMDMSFSTKFLYDRIEKLESKIARMQSTYTNRPPGDYGTQYKYLKLYIENFLKRVGSKASIIDELVQRVFRIFDEERFNIDKIKLFSRNCLNLMKTIQNSIDHIRSSFSLYTDLTTNFLTGVSFTLQGLKLLRVSIETSIRASTKGFRSVADIEGHIEQIIGVSSSSTWKSSSILLPSHSKTQSLFPSENAVTMHSNLLKITLCQLNNRLMFSPTDAVNSLPSLLEILSQFHTSWLQDLHRKEEEREKKESLYQFKQAKSTLGSDDACDNQEFINICSAFPTYDYCFKDLHGDGNLHVRSELDNMVTEEKILNLTRSVDLTDGVEICKAHLKFIRIAANGLLNHRLPESYADSSLTEDSIQKILHLKSQVFSDLFKNNLSALSQDFDSKFLEFFMLQTTSLSNLLDDTKDQDMDTYDIYRDPNPKEVRRLQDFFDLLHQRINLLYIEYPNHVTLVSIAKLIHRIGSFLITEPLMKFLTGSHAILEVIESWNTQVPSEHKLIDEEEQLNELLNSWRNLEIQCWKNSLLRAERTFSDDALCHLWFNLYTAYANPIECGKPMLTEEEQSLPEEEKILLGFSKFLVQFVEASKFGDYLVRLELLFAFTVQTRLLQLSGKTSKQPISYDKLIAMSYNLYCLYSTIFSKCKNEVEGLSKKLTKEMDEAITIVKWRGRRHWDLKNTLRNAQRKINNVLKKYRTCLNLVILEVANPPTLPSPIGDDSNDKSANHCVPLSESVSMILGSSLLIKPTNNGVSMEDQDYLRKLKLFKLSRSVTISKKFMLLSRQIVDAINPKYPESIYQLEGALSNLRDNISNYQAQNIESLTINTADSKEVTATKKRQLGQMLNTRRFVLTTVFKQFNSLGLSYRYGLKNGLDYVWDLYSVIPLGSMLTNPGSKTLKTADKALNLNLMEDCNHLYYLMMAQNSKLMQVSGDHAAAIDYNLSERLRGYAIHLMLNICQHHKAASQSYMHMLNVQSIIVRLESLESKAKFPDSLPLFDFTTTHSIIIRLDHLSSISIDRLRVLKDILDSSCTEFTYRSNVSSFLSSDMCNRPFLDEEQVRILRSKIQEKSQALIVIKQKVQAMLKHTNQNHIYSIDDVNELKALIENQHSYLVSIKENIIKNNFNEDLIEAHPNSLRDIILVTKDTGTLKSQVEQLLSGIPCCSETKVNIRLAKCVDSLIKKLMIIMQNVLKYESSDELSSSKQPLKQINPAIISQNLQLDAVDRLLNSCVELINDGFYCSDLKPIIKGLTPLIAIYNKNVTSYMNVMLSSLYTKTLLACKMLPFFVDILLNGLGTPVQIEDHSGQQSDENLVDSTDAGIGEGQGNTDVSKRLEFESQLDGLKQNEDAQENDEDSPDAHEDGVEMSEDFEGQAHGADAERGDEPAPDENQDDPNEDVLDLDKQMGDVDLNDEVLDDKIWGEPDNDEEELRNAPDEEGKQNLGSSDMVAKDDNQGSKSSPDEKEIDLEQEKDNSNENEAPIPSDDIMDDEYQGEDTNKDHQTSKESEPLILPDDKDNDVDFTLEDISPECNDHEVTEKSGTQDSEDAKDGENEGDDYREVSMDTSQTSDIEDGEIRSDNDDELNRQRNAVEQTSSDDEFIDRELEEALNSADQDQTEKSEGLVDATNNQPIARECGGNLFYDVYPEHKDELMLDEPDAPNLEASNETGDYGIDLNQNTEQRNGNDFEEDRLTKKIGKRVQDESSKAEDIAKKRQKILDSESRKEQNKANLETPENHEMNSSVFRHVENKDDGTTNLLDVAQESDDVFQVDSDEADEPKSEDKNEKSKQEKMAEEKKTGENEDEKSRAEAVSNAPVKSRTENSNQLDLDPKEGINSDMDDGEINSISQSSPGVDTTFETNYGLLRLLSDPATNAEWLLRLDELNKTERSDDNMETDEGNPATDNEVGRAASLGWMECSRSVSNLVFQLCEQLQIVLQPTKMSKYKGDYRSGKRLNIRKIIPYIASQYRKDKIWLRRTKPSKRTYQISIAVDDSSSMSENNCRLMAFQSLALLAKSLSLIEAGSLSILSFGEDVKTLHDFEEPLTDSHGSDILKKLTFKQKKTRYAHLLQKCTDMFGRCVQQTSNQGLISQLLIIISDGRNVLQEGEKEVLKSLKQLQSMGVMTLFIIVDDNKSDQSILDMKKAWYDKDALKVQMRRYMEVFPFPFYVILRQMEYMPSVLGEGLRQWFELVSGN